jgi:subtilisin family serine protease
MESPELNPKKETIAAERFQDFRSIDLSTKSLKEVPKEVMLISDFDTQTIWPEPDKLPIGFNPEEIIEKAKDPGLGIRELHQDGIDGRGVTVAIIDQSLASKRGEFMPHKEYVSNITDYKEFGLHENEGVSMHGPAVASLLVGKTCGVAPEAKLVYRARPGGNYKFSTEALLDIIETNKSLAPKDKVRIVSCSMGLVNGRPNLDEWNEAIRKAEKEGIMFIDTTERSGDCVGGGASEGKDNVDNYDLALFFKEPEKVDKGKAIIVPCDYRTMASQTGPEEYMYNGKGGMSWSVPYLAGIFALVLQIRPDLKKEQIMEIINETATINDKGLKVINPKGIIEDVKKL